GKGKDEHDDDDSHPDKAATLDNDSHPGKASHDDDSHPGKASHDDDDSHPGKAASLDNDSHPGKASHDDDSHPGKASHDLSAEHPPQPPQPSPGHATGKDTVMSDAASDQFIFGKGHDTIADHKPDMTEIDHTVPAIQHLLDTAHDTNTNTVSALDPNHATAPQDMTKVQLSHQHGDFHFA